MYVAVGWTSTVVVEWGRRKLKNAALGVAGSIPSTYSRFQVLHLLTPLKTEDRVLWRLLPEELRSIAEVLPIAYLLSLESL
jgi:hypothetical protein